MDRLVVLVGAGRSGSSLVHEVLARHPDVGFLTNVEDRLGPAARAHRPLVGAYRRMPPSWTRKGRLRLAPSEGYRQLSAHVSPALARSERDLLAADADPWLADRLRGFVESLGQRSHAPVLVHKLTGWPRARLLAEVLPEARFVHVVRDGRAVATSLLQMPWWGGWGGPGAWRYGPLPPTYAAEWEATRSFPVLAGITWKLMVDAADACAAELPAHAWHEVRYEDVVADPRPAFASLLDTLGLPWSPEFEARFSRHRFSGARADSFRRELSPGTLAVLESSLAGHLRARGYLAAPPTASS